jgi:hypothetical protein
MKDGKPENIHMQFGNLVEQTCRSRGLPMPMATEFNMHKGGFRLHLGKFDPNVARQVAKTGQVVLREILDCLNQKDIELAKTMIQKELKCF